MKTAVDIRVLTLSDLDAIEDIEQRAYDTPWSRSMFAGELAKPASLCLGAFEGEQLAAYMIVSRYVDAWHIMNIAVSPDFRRRGIATALLERLFELTEDRSQRGYTLEVRVSNEGAIMVYERLGFTGRGIRRGYYTDNREDALIMWRDPPRATVSMRDPRARDVLRRDGMRARRAKTGGLSNVVSSQAELHARYGGVVPEVASRRHLELVDARCARRARRGGSVAGRRARSP